MELVEIRDWLKTLNVAEHYYIGRLENKKEKSLGVYSRADRGAFPVMAVGGVDCSGYDIKRISLLLHWNRNAAETEEAAQNLWGCLFPVGDIVIPSGSRIQYIQPTVPEPVSVGNDDNGIYEYVIEMNIYYRR